jgi:putative membrane protein
VLRLIFGWHGVGNSGTLMTWEIVLTYSAFQIALFAAVYAAIRFTPLELWLTPVATRHKKAHDKALEQFYAQGLHKTQDRTGVLIFAALEEHHVEIIADEGIYSRVDKAVWSDAIAVLVDNIKHGDLTHGYEEAIAQCGKVLAEHFPPGAVNPNESPDVLIEI